MAYVVHQPTLIARWPELDEFVRSIGPFLACAWCALERSRVVSAPVALGGLASDALDTLAKLQVLRRVPIEDPRPAARSLYEPLAWSYRASWSRAGTDLEALLTGALVRLAADSDSRAKRGLGVALGRNEARAYLANLLRKHRLDPSLGDGLRSTQLKEWEALSLGRKRYVLWASMRNASSAVLQSDMDGEPIWMEKRFVARLTVRSAGQSRGCLDASIPDRLRPPTTVFYRVMVGASRSSWMLQWRHSFR
ncbi:hypothetical protein D3C71_579600 [compost metagenome]